MPTENLPHKPCVICGRTITWRKKWERDWESVKYCSDRCRRTNLDDLDQRLELVILQLLSEREKHATICPSEAARVVAPSDVPSLMERTRMAARRLVEQGAIVITQGGSVVDPSKAKGPIRLRKA